MRALLTLAMLLPLAFGSGCFVFEEIDAGMAIMEAHTPAANKKKQEEEQAAAKAGKGGEAKPTYNQAVQAWWKDANTLAEAPSDAEDAGDPNATVSCRHGGNTFFTRRSDCLARGGKAG